MHGAVRCLALFADELGDDQVMQVRLILSDLLQAETRSYLTCQIMGFAHQPSGFAAVAVTVDEAVSRIWVAGSAILVP